LNCFREECLQRPAKTRVKCAVTKIIEFDVNA
jgi:hypothetical protein